MRLKITALLQLLIFTVVIWLWLTLKENVCIVSSLTKSKCHGGGLFGSHRVPLKDKQTTAAAARQATSNIPPELSTEGRILYK